VTSAVTLGAAVMMFLLIKPVQRLMGGVRYGSSTLLLPFPLREATEPVIQILRSRACRALVQDDSAARLRWTKKLGQLGVCAVASLPTTRRGRPSPQPPREERRRRLVCRDPMRVRQEIVDVVREDQQLDVDLLLPQGARELHRLAELHVAVVVAVDQQHRRAPGL